MKLCVYYTCWLSLFVLFAACDHKSQSVTPAACKASYATDIKPIVAAKCALSGCHVAGATTGDFNNYADLKQRADNGRLRTNVFDLKIMPPSTGAQLTDQEKDLLKCWLDNGAQQN